MKAYSKTYSELISLPTFEERFNYLKENCTGSVGKETFGYDRYLYQKFLHSKEWRDFRYKIIERDCGCDLAMPGHEIYAKATVHHINPVTKQDMINHDPSVMDPENVITIDSRTHDVLTFGDYERLPKPIVERKPNDTCPWRR